MDAVSRCKSGPERASTVHAQGGQRFYAAKAAKDRLFRVFLG